MRQSSTGRRRAIIGLLAVWSTVGPALAQPANDDCGAATPIGFGLWTGDTAGATADGTSMCDVAPGAPDVWYSLTRAEAGSVFIETPTAATGVVLSIHDQCGGIDNGCSDASPLLEQRATVRLDFEAGQTYLLRVATQDFDGFPAPGPYEFRVGLGGTLTGSVIADEQTVAGIEVLRTGNGLGSRRTTTDDQGDYAFGPLPSGSYTVLAGIDSPFVTEIWDDIPCALLIDCQRGTPVAVALDQETAGVDFVLELGAAITGTVTDAAGLPLEGGIVSLAGDNVGNVGTDVESEGTNAFGDYRFEGLEAGTYTVRVKHEAFRPEVFDDQPCAFFGCDPAAGTPITVDRGETAAGIDFSLDRGATISGRVIDATTQEPVAFEVVHLLDETSGFLKLGRTDGDGRYALDLLNPGTYLVRTVTATYIDELWNDVTCGVGSDCPVAAATPIIVDLDQLVENIDFMLAPGGTIRGLVVDAATNAAVPDAIVEIYDADGEFLTTGFATSTGNYEVGGLVAGSYRAVGRDTNGAYARELYDDIVCDDAGCDVTAGTPIPVVPGKLTQANFGLDLLPKACVADSFTLCLNDGRFAVDATWRTPAGAFGQARAESLNGRNDSGYFWIFHPYNVEIVVKVLDACVEPFQHFWVFAAGLTNVEVEMKVVDTATGRQRMYTNSLGTRFQPIQDTGAFDTCSATPTTTRQPPSPTEVIGDLEAQLAAPVDRVPSRTLPVAPRQAGACVPSETALCLGDGDRFRVEATWRTPAGATGHAQAVPLVDDTGLFWFFSPNNVELVVKVLSNCGGSTDRFWVFAAGLTNVEVSVVVTDTTTGTQRTYQNPPGVRFVPIQDTQAFDTCP